MKKTFLLGILAFLISFSAFSQGELRLGLNFSPIVSFPRVTDEDRNVVDDLNNSAKIGFSGGLKLDYNISESVALHSGVQIVRKGYKSETDSSLTDVSFTAVEIPLALKMRSGEVIDGVRIRGLFGLQLGLNVGASTTVEANRESITNRRLNNYNLLIPDFIVGVGAEIATGDVGMVDVGFSYHHGLTRVTKKRAEVGRVLMSYFSLDLGFYF
ncbi:MAG: PorT family protein [Bernardetiaceae bacterium]|nr:PorT family protein [Bernardetiaceae bacterium]